MRPSRGIVAVTRRVADGYLDRRALRDRRRAAPPRVAAIRVDVTAYAASRRKLTRALGALGPPTPLCYRAGGAGARKRRPVGAGEARGFVRRPRAALGQAPLRT